VLDLLRHMDIKQGEGPVLRAAGMDALLGFPPGRTADLVSKQVQTSEKLGQVIESIILIKRAKDGRGQLTSRYLTEDQALEFIEELSTEVLKESERGAATKREALQSKIGLAFEHFRTKMDTSPQRRALLDVSRALEELEMQLRASKEALEENARETRQVAEELRTLEDPRREWRLMRDSGLFRGKVSQPIENTVQIIHAKSEAGSKTSRYPRWTRIPPPRPPGGPGRAEGETWAAGASRAFGDVRQAARGLNAGLAVAIMTPSMRALSKKDSGPALRRAWLIRYNFLILICILKILEPHPPAPVREIWRVEPRQAGPPAAGRLALGVTVEMAKKPLAGPERGQDLIQDVPAGVRRWIPAHLLERGRVPQAGHTEGRRGGV
jgi:hypothetical protein